MRRSRGEDSSPGRPLCVLRQGQGRVAPRAAVSRHLPAHTHLRERSSAGTAGPRPRPQPRCQQSGAERQDAQPRSGFSETRARPHGGHAAAEPSTPPRSLFSDPGRAVRKGIDESFLRPQTRARPGALTCVCTAHRPQSRGRRRRLVPPQRRTRSSARRDGAGNRPRRRQLISDEAPSAGRRSVHYR